MGDPGGAGPRAVWFSGFFKTTMIQENNMCDSATLPANTLVVKRFVKAPPERIFAAWTSADELPKWFGPATCRITSASVQAQVGGKYRLRVSSEVVGEVEVHGQYRELTRPSRLVFTWQWAGNPQLEFGPSTVAVDLLAVEGGTDIHLTHELLPNAEARDHHTIGWNGCLDKLQCHLGVGEPPAKFGLGHICWNELLTNDVPAAGAFYTQLLGWQAVSGPPPIGHYTVFKMKNQDVGGMMACPMSDVPPHWLAYVHVTDVDALVQKVSALGGQVISPAFDIPTVGRIAIMKDPQGAVLGLFKPDMAAGGK